jgi:hypothetical protein
VQGGGDTDPSCYRDKQTATREQKGGDTYTFNYVYFSLIAQRFFRAIVNILLRVVKRQFDLLVNIVFSVEYNLVQVKRNRQVFMAGLQLKHQFLKSIHM